MPKHVVYVAVLPRYRQACVDSLLQLMESESVQLICSSAHLDQTVTTGIRHDQYTEVRMMRIMGKAYLQLGEWRTALECRNLIVDWNPRSLSAWAMLMIRRLRGRRTVLWGHLHARKGRRAHLNPRDWMAGLADGLVTYTYEQSTEAAALYPDRPVWVAPNALYSETDLQNPPHHPEARTRVIYVGRLEPEKKPMLLVEGFKAFASTHPHARLTLVGDGSEMSRLKARIEGSWLASQVDILSPTHDVNELRSQYDSAFASVSAGYVGLGLTQSLSFGVPQVYADDEPHAPEIELAKPLNSYRFTSDDPSSLAAALQKAWDGKEACQREAIVTDVRERYTSERMAKGLAAALQGPDSDG